jgi:hypothetical protein
MRARLLLLAVAVFAGARAEALTLLSAGKVAIFRDRLGSDKDGALIRFGPNRGLATLIDPTCTSGNPATLEIASYPQTNVVVSQGLVTLRCEHWRETRAGYVYEDATGAAAGVRKIVYSRRKLVIRIQGAGYQHVAGPVGYVEAWFGIGTERLLGRFHNFRKNEQGLVMTRKPSHAAAEGEQAFWDVLWGDDDSETRQQVALHCLSRAARRDKRDGRSRFLLGMMLLYRFGQTTPSYLTASDASRELIRAAQEAFDAAVPLLWDGTKGDSRVPGFAAATTYVHGVVHGDAALAMQGLAALDESVAINPVFNTFDLIGVVPQAILPTDPLYARVLAVMDTALNPQNANCVVTQPEVCGNVGMAPSNIFGAFLLFGDLYAKGLVLDDPYPFRGARNLYNLTVGFSANSTWNPAFKALAAERLATVDERVALYQNGDPSDDPPLIGSGRGEACRTCHLKR